MTHALSAHWTQTRRKLIRDKQLTLEARQVICMTGDQGFVWIDGYDVLPPAVRRRLRDSAFNICPTCLDIEAHKSMKTPTVAHYLTVVSVVEAFERKLWAPTVTP
jgi:hypothetical protein